MANVSQSELAKIMGLSKQRINKLVKNGTLKPALRKIPDRKKPLLDADVAVALLNKYLDAAKQRTGGGAEYQEARRRSVRAKVKLMQQNYEEKLDKYIRKSEVQEQGLKIIRISQKHIGQLPAQIVKSIDGVTDRNKVLEIFNEVINQIFEKICRDLKRL